MKNLIDDLRKAQSVFQIFEVFGINAAFGTLNENANDIADFIETNYYQKPRSADGTPVDIGTEWYGEDGRKWYVVGYHSGKYNILAIRPLQADTQPLKSEWLSKDKPDSFEAIINEAVSLTDIRKRDGLIERCKRLAGELNE